MNNYTTLSDYKDTDNIIVFQKTINSTNIDNIADYKVFDISYNYDIHNSANTDKITNTDYIKIDKTNMEDIKIYKSTNSTTSITGDTLIYNLPMICDNTYPMFLAANDTTLSKSDKNYDNNVFRCAYSSICKVPWSDMNCDKYNKQN